MLTAIALVSLASMRLNALHPSFVVSQSSFDHIWTRAVEDGKKRRDPNKGFNLARKVIDTYHTGPIGKDDCAWAYLIHPKLLIRFTGYQASSQYWPQQEVDQAKQALTQLVGKQPSYIEFLVDISEMPSFQGAYGTLSRHANPDNLKDIRCVLKVGDRILQPTSQPGDITVSRRDSINFFLYPQTTFVRGSTSSTTTFVGSGGFGAASTSAATSYQVTTYGAGEEAFSVYSGQFIVRFPLIDSDGVPTVKDSDKEMQLLVVKRSAELKASYKLADWISALEK